MILFLIDRFNLVFAIFFQIKTKVRREREKVLHANMQIIQPDGSTTNSWTIELNGEQKKKYSSNQMELNKINNVIQSLQKRSDCLKKELKTLKIIITENINELTFKVQNLIQKLMK